MSTPRMSIGDAQARVAAFFESHNCGQPVAASVARALVMAEADGLKGHGLSRLATYAGMLDSGKIDGHAEARVQNRTGGAVMIDAATGFAYPAIDLAIAELVTLAPRQGIAAAAIHRSSHCGAVGHHVERLAGHGLVAMMFANTPSAIAPWGGQTPVFGTNPIAFAAPLEGRAPVVIDLSVSKVARGQLLSAKQRGVAIPEGWALDAEGKPTTDPARGLAGTMVPMGDAKGAALALMVEILAGCLVGAHLGFEASSFLDAEGPPPETGQLLIAFAPDAFAGARVASRLAALAAAIELQSGTRLPGLRRLDLRRAAERDGLDVPAELRA